MLKNKNNYNLKMASASDKYKKLSDQEHILKRPGMYIGSVKNIVQETFIYDDESKKMDQKQLKFNPGLLKLFDEIATNASDHTRNSNVTLIKVEVDSQKISVYNDGEGIPIEIHKEHNVYIPELIFGHFRAGSNFDDTQKRITGGMNGLGSKIVGVFSTLFEIEVACKGSLYKQTFENNLKKINKPIITKTKKNDYTKITFYPDFQRFGMKENTPDQIKLFEKRTLDLSACTERTVNVKFNGKAIPVKDFESYINLYFGSKTNSKRVIIQQKRWKVAFLLNDKFDKFAQFSFVNGLCTESGGTHVNHVVNPVIKDVISELSKKHKDIEIKPNYVKDNLIVFVFALIENPEFKSQSKEELTTKVSDFGSTCNLGKETIKSIIKLGIDKNVIQIANAKNLKSLKSTDGKKKSKINIKNVDDANWAGTKKSDQCTLIIVEGLSAKTFAVSGIGKVGRDKYGIYPIKGKLLNVKQATSKQLLSNDEITGLKQVLGLKNGEKQTLSSIKKGLRYGKIVCLCDADCDGSHIKGLIINFFHTFWPQLLKDNFVTCLSTPVVKCSKGRSKETFYSMNDYNDWKSNTNTNGWKIKYYKGLGTSSAKEAQECFEDFENKLVRYKMENNEECIKLAFDKNRADDRKKWIIDSTKKTLTVDNSIKSISYDSFFNEEFVQFSIEDNKRSIPNLIDGLKPSQRKVLYGMFKKNTKDEIKLDQIRGFIAEKTAYHHGDMSLNQTIMSMNHKFVGSNNINLLEPCGQLGSRLENGKDAASPRYVSTKLNPITRLIFKPEDDQLLDYLDDDGYKIEPKYYVPIIPMLLVNGSVGIGTGFSCNIPMYNPKDIILVMKERLAGNKERKLFPWYNGFTGTITVKNATTYECCGVITRIDRTTLQITEIPIGKSIGKYKEILKEMEEKNEIESLEDNSTEEVPNFTITMSNMKINELIESRNLEKYFGLKSTISINNIKCFDDKETILNIKSVEKIIDKFIVVRKKLYEKRYNKIQKDFENVIEELNAKWLFIKEIIEEKIIIFRKPRSEIEQQIQHLPKKNNSYDYLLDMKIHSFTKEKMDILEKQLDEYKILLKEHNEKTHITLWSEDINELMKCI